MKNRRSSRALSLLPFVLALTPTALIAQEEPRRAYVLDAKALHLTAVSLETAEVLGRTALQGRPERMIVSPDGSRIVVLDKGPGKQTRRFGYRPKGKSWATVIDARTLEVVSRTELGWTVSTGVVSQHQGFGGRFLYSAEGDRLILACLGYRSKKPHEALAHELVSLDLAAGQVVERLELERGIDALLQTPDGATAVVYSGWQKGKKKQPGLPAELRFIKLDGLEVVTVVTLAGNPGTPTLSPDRKYLYLLEQGKPDKKPEKNINGRLQVVSLETQAHETNLDVGSGPRGLVVDAEAAQSFVLADGEPSREDKKKRPGLLTVIRGAEAVARVRVGEKPRFLRISPNRERLHVVGEKTMTTVDLWELRAEGPAALKPAGSWASGKKPVKELAITQDGLRGYVLYYGSRDMGVLDLEREKVVAEVKTGRGGIAFLKQLGAAAASAGSYYAAQAEAQNSGGGMFYYDVYTAAPPNTGLVFRSDERFIYVLNTGSNDVTIVDAQTNLVVDKIGIGGSANRLEALPGGDHVAVTTGKDTLHLIDVATNQKIKELEYGGNFVLSPDEQHALAIDKGVLYCLKGGNLEALGQVPGFKKPTQVAFQSLPEPGPEVDVVREELGPDEALAGEPGVEGEPTQVNPAESSAEAPIEETEPDPVEEKRE